MRFTKVTLLVLALFAISFSALQERFHIFSEPDLKGYSQRKKAPSLKQFTWKGWLSGGFQDEFSQRLNDNTGLRNSLIRLNNQYDYSLYSIIHADGFILGKQHYLYEEDYIHEYTGDYFIGKTAIDRKLSRLKNVTDSLGANGIPLLLVYEPGKASFYPEYIPERFHPGSRSVSNYEYFVRQSERLGLPFIDMNRLFLAMKDTSSFPLFPRYGMHWSLYGVPYAVDTLAKTVGLATGISMPKFSTLPVVPSNVPQGTDYDIGELLNLVFPLPPTPGAYPTVTFGKTGPGSLSVLVIADSYYINIVETYGRKLFQSQEYWYYNRKMYPNHNNSPPQYVDKSNLHDRVKNFDVILLMVSEINLHCGFWGFADEAFLAFHPEIRDPLIYGIENDIRNDREWFRFMVEKARLKNCPLEEVIHEDAGYTFYANYDSLQGKSYWDTVYRITFDIRNNPEWLSQVVKKAKDLNISVDSMLLRDAIYSYEQSKKNH